MELKIHGPSMFFIDDTGAETPYEGSLLNTLYLEVDITPETKMGDIFTLLLKDPDRKSLNAALSYANNAFHPYSINELESGLNLSPEISEDSDLSAIVFNWWIDSINNTGPHLVFHGIVEGDPDSYSVALVPLKEIAGLPIRFLLPEDALAFSDSVSMRKPSLWELLETLFINLRPFTPSFTNGGRGVTESDVYILEDVGQLVLLADLQRSNPGEYQKFLDSMRIVQKG